MYDSYSYNCDNSTRSYTALQTREKLEFPYDVTVKLLLS